MYTVSLFRRSKEWEYFIPLVFGIEILLRRFLYFVFLIKEFWSHNLSWKYFVGLLIRINILINYLLNGNSSVRLNLG